jgi:hypothetical protein
MKDGVYVLENGTAVKRRKKLPVVLVFSGLSYS